MSTSDLVNFGYFIIALIASVVVGLYGADIRGAFSQSYNEALKKALVDFERLEGNASAMAAACAYRIVLSLVFLILLCTEVIWAHQFETLSYIFDAINMARFGNDLDVTKDWWFVDGWWSVAIPLLAAFFLMLGFVTNFAMVAQYKDMERTKLRLSWTPKTRQLVKVEPCP